MSEPHLDRPDDFLGLPAIFRVRARSFQRGPTTRPGLWHLGITMVLRPSARGWGGPGFRAYCGHQWPFEAAERWDQDHPPAEMCPRCAARWGDFESMAERTLTDLLRIPANTAR